MNARWKFWLITGCAVLAVLATLALGRWQLSRAGQKLALQASIDGKARLPPLTAQALLSLADPVSELHRGVQLRGRWIGQRTVFLDNRQMNDKPGFFVVTPLQLEGSNAVVLVQRGWVARNFVDRNILPKLVTPQASVDIIGRIAPSPGKLYQLGDAGSGVIRQNLDLQEFSTELALPVLAVSVLQTDISGDGLLRDWPRISSGVETHYGYAFQWFGLSSLITILYVWFQLVRRFFQPR